MLTHSMNYSMQKNQVELRVTLKVDTIYLINILSQKIIYLKI